MKIEIYRYGNYVNYVTNDERLHAWLKDNVYYGDNDGEIPDGTSLEQCLAIAENAGYGFVEDTEMPQARELCARVRIEDIVGDTTPLELRASNYICDCPFCGGRHVAYVSPKYQIFGCFGCGAKENAVTFVMRSRGLNFTQARRWIKKKYTKR